MRSSSGPTGLKSLSEESPIGEFYAGKSVLITGVSGFVGKVILEKILRSCEEVKNVYVLIRSKRGACAEKRLAELLDNRPFTFRLDEDLKKKVIAVEGDISEPELGLIESDRKRLQEDVNIVLHVAASVKFEAPLR